MKYPEAVWRPVTNVGAPIAEIYGVAVHVQEGNGSLVGWFSNPASQASSHVWFAKDGVVEQYVDTLDQAWAQAAGNLHYLSAETEGFATEPLTPAQLASLRAFIDWAAASYGFPVRMTDHGGHGVTTHAFFPSGVPDPAWGGHPCPGPVRSAQLPALVAVEVPPVPAPITRPPVAVKAAFKVLVSLPTDAQGNGWTPGPLGYPFDNVLGVWISPNLTAGGTPGTAKAGPDGPGTYVEVSGASPNSVIGVWLTIAS